MTTYVFQMTLQKSNKQGYETLPHPAYLPDLSPTDYHCFKHLDKKNVKVAAQNALKESASSKTTEFYVPRRNRLVYFWQQYLNFNSPYFD